MHINELTFKQFLINKKHEKLTTSICSRNIKFQKLSPYIIE